MNPGRARHAACSAIRTKPFGAIRTPTLIHQGAEDQLLPPTYARHLAATLPDAGLTMLPHSDHLYPPSRPFQRDLFRRIQKAFSAPRGDR